MSNLVLTLMTLSDLDSSWLGWLDLKGLNQWTSRDAQSG